MKSAVAIRHIAFEDLGLLQPLLKARGYRVHDYLAGHDEVWTIDSRDVDLLVVLGGPMGADQTNEYPFLSDELSLIRARLEASAPTLGICLGAQLMAVAAGGGVRAMPTKEIGLAPIMLNEAGRTSPLAVLSDDIPVLHWHGDEILPPPRVEVLAATTQCPVQAFRIGPKALGLQFHLEAELSRIGEWTKGHAAELRETGIDPRTIEIDAARHAARLHEAGSRVFASWLDDL